LCNAHCHHKAAESDLGVRFLMFKHYFYFLFVHELFLHVKRGFCVKWCVVSVMVLVGKDENHYSFE